MQRAYLLTDAGKAVRTRYWQSERGKAFAAKRRADPAVRITHQAHQAVAQAIRRGELAPASACQCNDCRKAPAVELHHHSYEPIHWLDVVPLCKACHIYRHANPESF